MAQAGQQYQYVTQYSDPHQQSQYQYPSQHHGQIHHPKSQQYQYHYPAQQHTPQHHQQYPQQHPHHYQQQYPVQSYQQYSQQYPQSYGNPYNQGHQVLNYSQGYQQPTTQPHGTINQAEPETCYNCGYPDHMAQNCPEPRREFPEGLRKRQKRFHNRQPQHSICGPITPNMHQYQGHIQQHYPQYEQNQSQRSFSPNTPQSAYSVNSQQWQGSTYQQSPVQQNQQAYHSNQYFAPETSYQSNSSQSRLQVQSPLGTLAYVPYTPQIQKSQTAENASRSQSVSGLLQMIPEQPAETILHHPEEYHVEEAEAAAAEIKDEDDLDALDLPDLPGSTRRYGDTVFQLISFPLPSNFVVADTLWPIPPPQAEEEGKCISKFIKNFTEDVYLQDMKVSPLWKDRQEDTMFHQVEDDGLIISLEECISKVQGRRKPQVESERQPKSRSQSESILPQSVDTTVADSLEKVERALAEAKAKLEHKARSKRSSGKHQQPSVRREATPVESELPFPVHVETGSSQANGDREYDVHCSQMSLHDTRPNSKARSIEKRPLIDTSPANNPQYDKAPHSQPNGNRSHTTKYTFSQRGSQPPLPRQDEVISPGRAVYPNTEANAAYDHGQATNERLPSASSVELSPAQSRSGMNVSRKRSYDQRVESSSDDDEDSPRRQETDITPKHKKRQPKVAAAYSRRW